LPWQSTPLGISLSSPWLADQIDCSADLHAKTSVRIFAAAGLDAELATALYELDFQSDSHPYAADAGETLDTLARHGIKVSKCIVPFDALAMSSGSKTGPACQ
jgi:hypothetical protein